MNPDNKKKTPRKLKSNEEKKTFHPKDKEDKKPFPKRENKGSKKSFSKAGELPKKEFRDRKSFGDKKEFRDRKPFGDKKEFRDRKSFGDKKEFRDRKPFGDKNEFRDRKSFGDKKEFRDRKPFGDKKEFRDRKSFGDKKEFRDRKPFGDKKEFRDRKSFGDKKEFRDRKPFGDKTDNRRKEFFKKNYSSETNDGFGKSTERKTSYRSGLGEDRNFIKNRNWSDRYESDTEEFDPYSVRRSESIPRDSFRKNKKHELVDEKHFPKTTKNFLIKKKKPDPEEIHREKISLLSKLNKNTKFTDIHDDEDDELPSELRINRFLAKCGFGSRRDSEKLISEGKVKINGIIVNDFSTKIQIGKDEVEVKGEIVTPILQNFTIAFNKPPGYISSHYDLHNENTVFHLLPKEYKRFFLAGRLDITSRGLMILSSDGDLIQTLSHPSFHQKKTYRLVVENCPDEKNLRESFLRGIEDDGEFLRAKEVEVLDKSKGLVKVVLEEGRKRQLHRMFAKVGAKVLDLQRISIGKLKLDDLDIAEGEFKKIEKEDIFY
ncbi:MAG: pseudouridine synthase [Leptospiraceae bacterium]|nr:pseudouridine synthase [Leptospiraceae bacterium]